MPNTGSQNPLGRAGMRVGGAISGLVIGLVVTAIVAPLAFGFGDGFLIAVGLGGVASGALGFIYPRPLLAIGRFVLSLIGATN